VNRLVVSRGFSRSGLSFSRGLSRSSLMISRGLTFLALMNDKLFLGWAFPDCFGQPDCRPGLQSVSIKPPKIHSHSSGVTLSSTVQNVRIWFYYTALFIVRITKMGPGFYCFIQIYKVNFFVSVWWAGRCICCLLRATQTQLFTIT